jgi:hypothetical protein
MLQTVYTQQKSINRGAKIGEVKQQAKNILHLQENQM